MLKLDPENIPFLYFSQTGEDKMFLSYLETMSGYFVDVGAFDPIIYSNTFALYLRGMRGINIEPNPDAIEAFKSIRPLDINLNLGVSKTAAELEYYSFSQPTCNTFSPEFAKSVLRQDTNLVRRPTQKIQTNTLTQILDEHAPKNQPFELLTIDVEGMDLEVLQTLDWERYRPHIVFVEDHTFNIESPQDSITFQFMKSQKYTLVGKTISTLMFDETVRFEKRPKL
ncbi:MAG: FkbM family methyltransferase [Verrucomicrobiota bacterium]